MIDEAAVFVMADQAAVQVFSAIPDERWDSVLPPVFDMPGADQPRPLRQTVNHYAYDNSWVPDMLAGRTMDEVGRERFDGDLLGTDPAAALRRISAAAIAAAESATDRSVIVHCSYGDCPVPDYFWQLNLARSLTAHDVAVHIGVADGLSEGLAEALFSGTHPTAEMWRAFGVFRAPIPVADDASWRRRFLALGGRRLDR